MKLKLLVSTMLLTAGIASAQSVSVGYAQRVLDSGTQEHQTSLSVKTAAIGKYTGDFGISNVQKDLTNAITTRTEMGVTYSLPVTTYPVKLDTRIAHCWKSKSGSETTQYYVIEPSVSVAVPDTKLAVKLGYRVREAYSANVADNSTTSRIAVTYAITKKDRVSFGRDWQRGDGALIQNSVQYSRAF